MKAGSGLARAAHTGYIDVKGCASGSRDTAKVLGVSSAGMQVFGFVVLVAILFATGFGALGGAVAG